MPTSGLVITAHQAQDIAGILATLESQRAISAGAPIGVRIPLVTETANKAEDKALWDWLWSVPGVAMLDVAFIHLDDARPSEATSDNAAPSPAASSAAESTLASAPPSQGNQR